MFWAFLSLYMQINTWLSSCSSEGYWHKKLGQTIALLEAFHCENKNYVSLTQRACILLNVFLRRKQRVFMKLFTLT